MCGPVHACQLTTNKATKLRKGLGKKIEYLFQQVIVTEIVCGDSYSFEVACVVRFWASCAKLIRPLLIMVSLCTLPQECCN